MTDHLSEMLNRAETHLASVTPAEPGDLLMQQVITKVRRRRILRRVGAAAVAASGTALTAGGVAFAMAFSSTSLPVQPAIASSSEAVSTPTVTATSPQYQVTPATEHEVAGLGMVPFATPEDVQNAGQGWAVVKNYGNSLLLVSPTGDVRYLFDTGIECLKVSDWVQGSSQILASDCANDSIVTIDLLTGASQPVPGANADDSVLGWDNAGNVLVFNGENVVSIAPDGDRTGIATFTGNGSISVSPDRSLIFFLSEDNGLSSFFTVYGQDVDSFIAPSFNSAAVLQRWTDAQTVVFEIETDRTFWFRDSNGQSSTTAPQDLLRCDATSTVLGLELEVEVADEVTLTVGELDTPALRGLVEDGSYLYNALTESYGASAIVGGVSYIYRTKPNGDTSLLTVDERGKVSTILPDALSWYSGAIAVAH